MQRSHVPQSSPLLVLLLIILELHKFNRRQSLAEGRVVLKCCYPNQMSPRDLRLLWPAWQEVVLGRGESAGERKVPVLRLYQSGNIKPREIVEEATGICNLFINIYAIIRNFLK